MDARAARPPLQTRPQFLTTETSKPRAALARDDDDRRTSMAKKSTPTSTDIIPFDVAVHEAKAILEEEDDVITRGQWRLGELAHKLEPRYRDRTIAKFAEAIGRSSCTVARWRDVYRAWHNISAPGRKSISYAVLRELATHPDRAQIIEKYPAITKRAAHDFMRKLQGTQAETQEQAQINEWSKHNRKWFKALIVLANEASRMAAVVDECSPEHWCK
jgi:hypothetical protein